MDSVSSSWSLVTSSSKPNFINWGKGRSIRSGSLVNRYETSANKHLECSPHSKDSTYLKHVLAVEKAVSVRYR